MLSGVAFFYQPLADSRKVGKEIQWPMILKALHRNWNKCWALFSLHISSKVGRLMQSLTICFTPALIQSLNINTEQFSLASFQHPSSIKAKRIHYPESSVKIHKVELNIYFKVYTFFCKMYQNRIPILKCVSNTTLHSWVLRKHHGNQNWGINSRKK